MKKERAIYAGDVVRIIKGNNEGGDAGYVGAPEMRGDNVLRVVHGVEFHGDEINVVVFRDEARKEGVYRYARKNIELVLTASGKTKRKRAPRGEHWDIHPYPPQRGFRVARPEPIPAPPVLVKVEPVKPVVQTAEEKRKVAKEQFHNAIMKGSGVSQWLYRTNAGWKQFVGAVCHASLRGAGTIYEHYEGIAGVFNKLTEDGKAEYRRWFDYLVNRSPWKDVYVTKDIDEALLSHVEINVKLASPIVMGAITILRTGHEYPISRRLFCHLIDKGVPEFAAMAATSFINNGREGYLYGGFNTNHTIFNERMNPLAILQFMLDGYSDKVKNTNVFHETRTVRDEWSFGIFNAIAPASDFKKSDIPWLEETKAGFSKLFRVDLDKFKEIVIQMQEKVNGK